MALPNHIAIIPDGNRRWAKKRLLPAFMGHQAGAETTEKVFQAALDAGVKHLTFWGASIANVTKRDPSEVAFLYKLFEQYFKKLTDSKTLKDSRIRVRVLGFWVRYFPASLKAVIKKLEESTADYSDRHLTFLLAYNGTDEMIEAIQKLRKEDDAEVGPEAIKKHLFTKDLPPVDLVIRTGCGSDPHNSAGFMMWDTAESQLYFTDLAWPDFGANELKKALDDYNQRERRLGA